MAEFWLQQEAVYPKNGYHGPQLSVNRDTNQGDLAPPTLFNMAVDSMVLH